VATARLQLHDPRRSLHTLRREVDGRVAALSAAARRFLLMRKAREEQLTGKLQALSPVKILERGYALVFDAEGKLVKDAAQVEVGGEIRARVHRGELKARVTGKSDAAGSREGN
jgi:exodeoxyribonuclease VII large subunit